MSLVLAFGLSPLGQVPAYADDKAPAEQLQTEAGVYSFKSISIMDENLDNVTASTYSGLDKSIYVTVVDSNDASVGSSGFSLTVKGSDGKEVEGAVTPSTASDPIGAGNGYKVTLKDADTYTLSAKGSDAGHLGASIPGTYTINTLSLGSLVNARFTQAGTLEYDGTNKTAAVELTGTGAENYNLVENVDYRVELESVKDARTYTANIIGIGDCTDSAEASISVAKAQLLNAASDQLTAVSYVKVTDSNVYNSAASMTTSTGYVAGFQSTVSSEPTTGLVAVPFNKVADPIELTYEKAAGTEVTLVENTDYTVEYRNYVAGSGWKTQGTAITGALPSEVGDKYWANITLLETSPNFKTVSKGATTAQTITALLVVGGGGTIESFVDHANLADGVYSGGASVKADLEAGAAFYDEDGNDITDQIGENFKILPGKVAGEGSTLQTYGVLATNTYNSARVSAGAASGTSDPAVLAAAGLPLGAGQYYTYVTGDGAYTAGTAGKIAYFTVLPKAAVVGTAVGDLKVTVTDAAYKDGDYVEPSIKVEMITTKGGATREIYDKEYTDNTKTTTVKGALNQDIVNWKVTYWKDGTQVEKPSVKGAYQAKIEFSGNLEGTQSITKDFEVEAGDISSITDAVMVLDSDDTSLISPSLYYTGTTRELDKSKVKFRDSRSTPNASGYLSEDDLNGTDFELSYSAKSATPDPATGKPVVPGTYTVTATFSGTYTGTVTGTFTVNTTDLTKDSQSAVVQYLQADGSYDDKYSVKATGSAIEPTVRIAILDGNENGTEPTLVDESVYSKTFKKNTTAAEGPAEVILTAKQGYADYVSTSSAAASTFTITGKSFGDADVAATLKLDKDSADYSAAITFKAELNSGLGVIGYNSDTDSNGMYPSAATDVTVNNAKVWSDGETTPTYYAKTAEAQYAEFTPDSTTKTAIEAGTPASVKNEDNLFKVTYDTNKVCYVNNGTVSAATKYYTLKSAAKYVLVASETTPGTFTSSAASTLKDDANPYQVGTLDTLVFDDVVVYGNDASGTKYYEKSSVNPAADSDVVASATYGGVTGSAASATAFTAAKLEAYNYSLKVLDPDGNTLPTSDPGSSKPYVTIAAASAPYTTVSVTLNNVAEAGEYTVVAGAGSSAKYGGRVTADFTVNGIDISDATKFAVTWTDAESVVHPLSDEWKVSYNAVNAKKVAGITLGTPGVSKTTASSIVITGATGTALPVANYEVTYEDNHAAGSAKVVIEGKGNYTGKIEQPFTIEQAVIAPATATLQADGTYKYTSGYHIDFDQAIYDKASKSFRMAYTGEQLKPSFTINYYDGTGKLSAIYEGESDTAWYNNTDVHYGKTGIDDYATVQITAKGNYKGTLEGSFYIDPVTLTADNATYAVADVAYTGNVAQPKATVTWNGKELVQGKDFAVDVAGATEVGSYTATIKQVDGGNFLMPASVTRDFKVTGLNLSNAEVKLAKTSITYTGKAQKPAVESVTVDGNAVNASLYEVSYPTAKNVGTYDVTVSAKGSGVTGSAKASFQITKAANTLKVANAKRTVKAAKLKKAAQKITGVKVSTKGQGTMTYKVTKVVKGKKSVAKKNFKVAKSTANKLTVKKGLAKGTYKVTMTAKAKGNANYNASSKLKKVVTVVVK